MSAVPATRSSLLSRRRFVGHGSAFAALAAGLGACALDAPNEASVSGFDRLRVINWSEYIDPELSLIHISEPTRPY